MNNMAHAVLRLLEKQNRLHTGGAPRCIQYGRIVRAGLEHCDAIAGKNLLVRDQKKRFYWLLVLYGEKVPT